MRILVVCLGNICRSPLAEGTLRRTIEARQLDWTVDSAGTGNWHIGEPPDPRSIAVGRRYDLDISAQRARQLQPADFGRYDHIFAMDRSNYRDILALTQQPADREKVHLFLAYAYPERDPADVPDPYWDDDGFEQVYQMLSKAAERVVDRLQSGD